MIRYSVTIAALNVRVDAVQSNWRSRASKRTNSFRKAGEYFEPPQPIWSEIKPVFMAIQNDKCAYCERQFAAAPGGAIELDVEHFRSKNAVVAWTQPPNAAYPFPTGVSFPDGYYLLAYHLGNYAVACKPCNTILKGSYFPIAGDRIASKDNPADLVAEQPLLIFPLGDQADDPQDLIRFDGVTPVPVSTNAATYNYQRARVTIDFFDLIEREELIRERSRLIFGLFLALRDALPGSLAEQQIIILTSPTHPHTSCARCFQQLYSSDPEQAEALARLAANHLISVHDAYIQRAYPAVCHIM